GAWPSLRQILPGAGSRTDSMRAGKIRSIGPPEASRHWSALRQHSSSGVSSRASSVVSLKYLYTMSDACYALAHAEYGCGNQVASGRARAIATMGVFPRNSATGGIALPNYLGSTGGSGQCVDRRGFGSEPAYGATVAQAGRYSRHLRGVGNRSWTGAQAPVRSSHARGDH